ncbi:hypothetical protein D3875_04330 [Deinococcus cavernae]|uniref:Uncharacterized protein n=1 Tax=Deinococcus cavernae TaxID=2320857 RepID=A0A418VEN4_9DEIO|nr:hypothetical protein [Deinococcus cavernae]RJF74513.1 hypothetical protein D3875_04330 [Deinococcus cavernae]
MTGAQEGALGAEVDVRLEDDLYQFTQAIQGLSRALGGKFAGDAGVRDACAQADGYAGRLALRLLDRKLRRMGR